VAVAGFSLNLLAAPQPPGGLPKAATGANRPAQSLTLVQPSEVLLPVGASQPFQLLDSQGNEVPSEGWSVSNPEIAELTIEGGHAILLGKAPGRVVLTNDSGARSREIVVPNTDSKVPAGQQTWILRPIDGRFAHLLWSSSAWGASIEGENFTETAPSYYYQDVGPHSAHVRAIRRDGLQVWQWPPSPSREVPNLIAGDYFGGALLYVGDVASRVLVDVNADGRERWRVAVPGFNGKGVNITSEGVMYFVQAEIGGGRILGLDARTGAPLISQRLDAGREVRRNIRMRGGTPVCAPGVEESIPAPFMYSRVLANVTGEANLAYANLSLVADAGHCTPGAPLALADIHVQVVQRLLMIDIDGALKSSETTIDKVERDGDASTMWIDANAPTNDLIPSPDGTGNILAVRTLRRRWLQPNWTLRGEWLYRITDARKVHYRLPVPVAPGGRGWTTVLGEGDIGFTSGGRTVLAFDTATGRERWRWVSRQSRADVILAAADGSLLVHEGDHYLLLRSGHIEARRTEEFMLFVQKLRPNLTDK
jgi:outer membrane protein assembly factor BamB